MAQDRLTKLVTIQVRKVDHGDIKSMGTAKGETPCIVAKFTLQSSDKIQKLLELVQMATGSAEPIFFGGKSIGETDQTVAQLQIKNGAMVAMPFAGAGGGSAKKWDRFLTIRHTDYYWMSYNYWESICFVP